MAVFCLTPRKTQSGENAAQISARSTAGGWHWLIINGEKEEKNPKTPPKTPQRPPPRPPSHLAPSPPQRGRQGAPQCRGRAGRVVRRLGACRPRLAWGVGGGGVSGYFGVWGLLRVVPGEVWGKSQALGCVGFCWALAKERRGTILVLGVSTIVAPARRYQHLRGPSPQGQRSPGVEWWVGKPNKSSAEGTPCPGPLSGPSWESCQPHCPSGKSIGMSQCQSAFWTEGSFFMGWPGEEPRAGKWRWCRSFRRGTSVGKQRDNGIKKAGAI